MRSRVERCFVMSGQVRGNRASPQLSCVRAWPSHPTSARATTGAAQTAVPRRPRPVAGAEECHCGTDSPPTGNRHRERRGRTSTRTGALPSPRVVPQVGPGKSGCRRHRRLAMAETGSQRRQRVPPKRRRCQLFEASLLVGGALGLHSESACAEHFRHSSYEASARSQ